MHKTSTVLLVSVMLAACDGESTVADQQSTAANAAGGTSDILSPPNPCSILTVATAQAELGASALTAAVANADAGQGEPPWTCAYESDAASVSLTVHRSSVDSSQSADALAKTHSAATGLKYTASDTGVGAINLVHESGATNKRVARSGLNWTGTRDVELIVEASVSSDTKTPTQRAESAAALVELYLTTARQEAALSD
ncbi:MAG: hypothetical protein AAF417_09135 [Pseudomonadota bacterium]